MAIMKDGYRKYSKIILVTGGAGFIGSNFLNKFVMSRPGYFFINLDALTYAGNLKNIQVKDSINYVFKKADIRDIPDLVEIFREYKPTGVIHFAAETHVDFSIEQPSIFIETNIRGTHNLLELSRKYGVQRFHYVSTDEVYGSLRDDGRPFTEKDILLPNNPYSASKASAEFIVRAYNKTYALNTVITRCSNNYGPFQDETKLIPKLITRLLGGKRMPIYGKGKNIRDWIYVEDHIDALDILFHKGISGGVYNIGGNCDMRNIDIARKLLTILNRDDSFIEFVEDRKGHDYRYAIDNSEIRKRFKWQPKVNIDEGLLNTVEFYRNRLASNE